MNIIKEGPATLIYTCCLVASKLKGQYLIGSMPIHSLDKQL